MPINLPFHHIARDLVEAKNSGYSSWAYIVDKEYAIDPHHYTRAFLIIQEDIKELFEYVEPGDTNLNTFSFRIYELFIRVCIEIEANFKAILRENIYSPARNERSHNGKRTEEYWNIKDYVKINITHHLDSYRVEFPFWRGIENIFTPFGEWGNGKALSWYKAFNSVKHDRNGQFEIANFKNLLLAFTVLLALLTSQFRHVDFMPGPESILSEGNSYFKGEFGIGGYLIIHYPANWSLDELRDFNWSNFQSETAKFQKFNYNKLL